MARQHFKTNDRKRTTKITVIAVIVFFILILSLCTYWGVGLIKSTQNEPESLRNTAEYKSLVILLTFCIFELCLIIIIPAAIFFGILRGRSKGFRENATFHSKHGIEYYRDFLTGVSPATMSILVDLKIEDKKDISATLLCLYNKNMIDFKTGCIVCTGGTADLDNGERELLEMLQYGGMNPNKISQWKKNRCNDAIADGYVERSNENKTLGCCLSGCLMPILFVVLLGFLLSKAVSNIDAFGSALDQISETGTILQSDLPVLTNIAKSFAIILLLSDMMIAVPCFIIVRYIAYTVVKIRSNLVRTPKGDEMAEKIIGIQRFINEFSTLSEAQKEQIVLWNDFLVYAVVLEENELIVNDIGKMFNKSDVVRNIRHFNLS